MSGITEEAKTKLVNLFSFFKAVEQRRTVLVRTIDERPWKLRWSELPEHRSLHIQLPIGDIPFSLTLSRPETRPCPTPPTTLESWLDEGWNDPDKIARHRETATTFDAQQTPIKIYFGEDPARPNDWNQWTAQRTLWSDVERPARAALAVWDRFFALHSQLEREGETYELMLGDGFFDANGVRHPILLRRVELSYQPQNRTFRLEDAGTPSEFFSPAFATYPGLPVKGWQQDVLDGDLHPLGGDGIGDWLKAVIGCFQDGAYVEGEPAGAAGHPRIGRAPVLFLRKREAGKLNFIEAILNDLHGTDTVSDSLLRIVGCAPALPDIEPSDDTSYANEDADILLTKPANAAQLSILRRLANRHGILVQGPPGTGKTHTIANLIGSLLAEGKTVLVTSHSTKALRVLRGQVAAPLRPLCVSVLDSDRAGKEELKTAVKTLAGRLDDDPNLLARDAIKLAESRKGLLAEIQSARSDLELAINGEYRPLIVDGKEYEPTQAAKDVAQGVGQHDWIPGPIHNPAAPPPISTEDLHTLYASSVRISQADEAELEQPLPSRNLFWSPNDFAQRVGELSALATRDLGLRRELWMDATANSDFDATPERMRLAMDILATSQNEPWRLAAIGASMDSAANSRVWQLICEDIGAVKKQADEAAEQLFRHSPETFTDDDVRSQLEVVDEIIAFLGKGKTLSTMNLLFHPKWKKLIESMRVEFGASPSTLEHFHALRAMLNLTEARNTLTARWQKHMEPHGLTSLKDAGSEPEHYAAQFVAGIKVCLAWHAEHWQPVESELVAHGLNWQRLLGEAPPSQSPHHQAERLRHTVTQVLPGVVAAELDRRTQARLLAALTELEQSLQKFGTPSVRKLVAAIETRDSAAYQQCYARIDSLLDLQPIYRERKVKLEKIRAAAPTWASAVQNRLPPHDLSSPPGDLALAWRWRQFSEELDRRAALSVPDLQNQIERLGAELTETTTDLVERRAWEALIRRVAKDDMARQALQGWAITTGRLGAGTGLNAEARRREAAKQMGKARAAVPVWIMPFSRLTENFDPVRDHFDVLIVDEASQEDVVGLAPFYMADKVIVVGDDEQVTPLDVGGAQQPIQDLIGQWLTDLPSPLEFDLKTSIYDRAHIAFGTAIRLREHFRCVPEIIQFSNDLSYGGDIKPLRDSASTPIKPALVAHRVKGTKIGKKNAEEAEAVAALIVAAIEQPEYAGKTFGVISLVSDDQSREIENLLRNRLDTIEYEKRRILCGKPAHFQGDERDVIFLTMVDSKEDGEGPLGRRGDGADGLWKKRYNVAASRAKDQLWVVYSLDHQTQLQPNDLRRRLIEHAIDPGALMRKLEDGLARTESPFEAEVFKLLTADGYQVKPQWPVGAYRIDMVVEGEQGKRLAIECDGDRWHYDKVAEDMARQALLERLGWRFARIRGTTFYRDRNRVNAMKPVLEKLAQAGIQPIGRSEIDPPAQAFDNQLLEAVKRRSNELRAEWAEPSRKEGPDTGVSFQLVP